MSSHATTDERGMGPCPETHWTRYHVGFDAYEQCDAEMQQWLPRILVPALNVECATPRERVLVDVGCGGAAVTHALKVALAVPPSVQWVAVEPSLELGRGVARYADLKFMHAAAHTALSQLGTGTNCVVPDGIVMLQMVHLLGFGERSQVFCESLQLLLRAPRPWSCLVIAMRPAATSWPLWQEARDAWYRGTPSPEDIVAELRGCGFAHVTCDKHTHRWGMTARAYRDFILNRTYSIFGEFSDEQLESGADQVFAALGLAKGAHDVVHIDDEMYVIRASPGLPRSQESTAKVT